MPTKRSGGRPPGDNSAEPLSVTKLFVQDEEFLQALKGIMTQCFEEAKFILENGDPSAKVQTMRLVMPVISRFLAPNEKNGDEELDLMKKDYVALLGEIKK